MLQRYHPYYTDDKRRFIHDRKWGYPYEITGIASVSEIAELIGERHLPRTLRQELFDLGWCRRGEQKRDSRPDIRETLKEIEQLQEERGK
jgi:hypothetical protein